MSDYIAEMQAVFLKLHGCDATYIETVPVVEEFQGETIWQGDVEIFDLAGIRKQHADMDGDTQQRTKAVGATSQC